MQIYIVKPSKKIMIMIKMEKKQNKKTKENKLKSNVMLDLNYILGI